jgi:hypothetical protein
MRSTRAIGCNQCRARRLVERGAKARRRQGRTLEMKATWMAGVIGAALMAVPVVAYAQGIEQGAVEGAHVGHRAAGPVGGAVGAVVGGVTGGVVGGVKGVLGLPQRPYRYHRHHRPYRHRS